MRSLSLLGVSAALFIFGVGFIVVGARGRTAAEAPAPAAVTATPVATVKQLMAAIAMPTSDAIFNSVQTNVTDKGVEEVAPKDDQEWAALAASAAALAEVGNLMTTGGRAVDTGDWVKMSQAMTAAAKETVDAAVAHDKEAVLRAGDKVNQSCDACHGRYRRQ